jgi:hypothetical protein
MADLYVMQSSAGLIKVGRSVNPQARRSTIEHYCGLPITLLYVKPGAADLEPELHYELRQYRLKGEWFSNTAASRATICTFLGAQLNFIAKAVGRNGVEPKRRKVRHRLKDGTVKVYAYPAYRLTKKYKETIPSIESGA